MRAYDWASTPLGPTDAWPASLRTIVGLMLTSKFPMFVAWGPELTFLYNDGYVPIFGAKHPAGLGQPFAKIWSEIWEDVGPLAEKSLAGEAVFREDLPLLMQRRGFEELTYFTFCYSPARNDEGHVAGVFCTCTETTNEVIARNRLQREKENLVELFRQAPGFMCVVRGPNHVFELTNDAYLQVVGYRDLIGKAVRDALPDLQDQIFFQLLDRVYETGEAFVGRQIPIALQDKPDGPKRQAYLDFVYQPLREHDGCVTGIFVEGNDVTDRTLAQARQRLLINELNHRVKNTLATVQAIAAQSFRAEGDIRRSRELFMSRLVALAKAHDILNRESWDGADLKDVVATAVEAFERTDEHRFQFEGPHVRLDAKMALSFALGLHELATNAAKYGAISSDNGVVKISWSVQTRHDAAPDRLNFIWEEQGGPTVVEPQRRGFGSRLLERGLGSELNGAVRLNFLSSGLQCQIDVPLIASHSNITATLHDYTLES